MAGRPWSDEEREIVRNDRTRTDAQLAAEMGRTPRAVQNMRRRLTGIRRNNWRRLSHLEIEFIRSKKTAGWSDTDIASELQIARWQVYWARKQRGILGANYSRRTRLKISAARLRFCRRDNVPGWPTDLPTLSTKILEALWNCGPMTRREVSQIVSGRPDAPLKNERRDYLAVLRDRGFINRTRVGMRCVFMLNLWITRNASTA